ncbi:MAG: TonB-dependent receptor [Acetobacter sp.]|jgi:iron complex outermembrane receptor protein
MSRFLSTRKSVTRLRHVFLLSIGAINSFHLSQALAATEKHSSQKAIKSKSQNDSPSPNAKKREKILVTGHFATGGRADYNHPDVNLGPLGTRNTLDAPFSVTTVDHDLIVNQQSRNINDLAQYMPSVQLEIRGDPNTSRPQSRGFEADVVANSRLDGLNIVSTTPYPAEWINNMQVLNGLSGALYGAQNPSGAFMYTLKRPTEKRLDRIIVGVDSIGSPLINGDFSGRVGHKGWFGYRLNLLHAGGTAYANSASTERNMVSGDFDFRIDDNTTIEVDASHYTYRERGTAPGFSIGASTSITSLPEAPDLSKSYLAQPWSGFNMETNTYLAKIKHKINENWSFSLGGLYQDAKREVFSTSSSLLDNYGNYSQTVASAGSADDFRVGSNMAYINGRVHTGPITHDLVIGTSGYMMGNYNPTTTHAMTTVSSSDPASIYNPRHVDGSRPYYSGRIKTGYVNNQSLIAGDTMKFNKHWSIMGTFAWSWIDQESWISSSHSSTSNGIKTTSYTKIGTQRSKTAAAFNPNVSLIYKPTDNQTLYFTWGRSIQPGSTAPTASNIINSAQTTDTMRAEEYEVGYKLHYRQFSLNVDGFRISSPYAYMQQIGTGNTYQYGIYGTQRNYGVEAQISGYILPNLSVMAGMTWIDAEALNVRSSTVSASGNKEVVGAAPIQANILLDYRLPASMGPIASRFAFNANVHYVGNRAANIANTLYTGDYTTLDLGTRYAFSTAQYPWMIRFGVSNVTNERYWASVYPSATGSGSGATSSLFAGLPRVYHFTVEADF